MIRKYYKVRLRIAATAIVAALSLPACTFQEMDRMSRSAQASGDIARGHVSEQMRSSQGALVWTDKPRSISNPSRQCHGVSLRKTS